MVIVFNQIALSWFKWKELVTQDMKKLRIRFWIVIISFSLIGFGLGSLITINPPNNRLATNSLQNNIFWDNIKELGTVIGGLIAVFTYFRNSNSRREDVALQKFKNTIAAEDYFHREFALSIDKQLRNMIAYWYTIVMTRPWTLP